MAGCSIAVVTICFARALDWYIAPFSAQLSDSEPPEVKYISFVFAPISDAISALASSTAFRASLPKECSDDGLPYFSVKYGSIASSASLSSLVVAELSRYTRIFCAPIII